MTEAEAFEPSTIVLGANVLLAYEAGSFAIIQSANGDRQRLNPGFYYQSGTFEDAIVDGEQRWAIARGRGGNVRQWIASMKLGVTRPADQLTATKNPLLARLPLATQLWLSRWLNTDERILAGLELAQDLQIATQYGDRRTAPSYFILTSHRAALCCVSDLGDAESFELHGKMQVLAKAGRDDITFGERSWQSTLTNESGYREVATLANADPFDRYDIFLARQWSRLDPAQRELELKQTPPACDRWPALTSCALQDTPADELELPIQALRNCSPNDVVSWWQRWGTQLFDAAPFALRLLHALAKMCDLPAYDVALPDIGSKIRATVLAEKTSLPALERVLFDHEYGQLLISSGHTGEAIRIIHALLNALPAPDQLALIAGEDAPDAPVHRIRRALLEELAGLPELNAQARLHVRREQHSLMPLDVAALRALHAELEGDALARCNTILEFLDSAGNHERDTPPLPKTTRLSQAQRQQQLSHPAGRAEAFSRLQSLLATVDVPDHSALKKYCEPGTQAIVVQAIRNACVTLDIPAIDAYVSRGGHSVGVQAHEGKPHFVLIGGDHLDPNSPLQMSQFEMQFALGAEIAHLSFGHGRVTSREVWIGAFDKGKATLDMALSIVPFLGAFNWGKRLGQITKHLDNHAVGKVLDRAKRWLGAGIAGKADLSLDRSVGLIAAHRLMQLTADRAGLILCGDVEAAFRAMFKLRRESAAELAIADSDGWSAAFERLKRFDEEAAENLRLRCGALISFYLSDDYAQLRAAVLQPETIAQASLGPGPSSSS